MSVKHAILNALMLVTLLALPIQCLIDPSAEKVARRGGVMGFPIQSRDEASFFSLPPCGGETSEACS